MAVLTEITTLFQIAGHAREWSKTLLGAVRRIRSRPDDVAPGDPADRLAAYLRFQNAAASTLLQLQFLATLGTPPKVAGALWTWPAAVRSMRQALEAMSETLEALLEVVLVGDREVRDAAVSAADALAETAHVFPSRRGGGTSEEFDTAATAAGERIVEFVEAGRRDLQKG